MSEDRKDVYLIVYDPNYNEIARGTKGSKSVVLKGELCLAKNWRELQEGNYDEVVASLVPPFGAPGNTRHKFYLTGRLSPYATQDLKNIAKALLKARSL